MAATLITNKSITMNVTTAPHKDGEDPPRDTSAEKKRAVAVSPARIKLTSETKQNKSQGLQEG